MRSTQVLKLKHLASKACKVSGERGIRTPGTLRYTAVPVLHNRPLCHLSGPEKILGGSLFVNCLDL